MARSVGWATLQILPVMPGIAAEINRQATGPMRQAGAAAGATFGDAVAEGVKKSEAAVVSATKKLSAERDKSVDSTKKVEIAELKLQELRDSGKAKASQIATAEGALERARRDNNKQIGAAEAAETQLTQARKRAADAADAAANSNDDLATSNDAVAESAESAHGGLKGMFSGLDSGTKQLAGLAAGAAGVGGAMELMGKSMDQGKIGSKLAASFGESAEEAKRYGKVAGDLYASGVGGSMDDIATAISAVGGSFGSLDTMGAARLEQLSAKASGFADIFDQDVAGSVQSASLLMQNGLAGNADEAFDIMTRGMQEVSVSMRDELPAILDEYGTNFRALGFNGSDAFNLLIAASQGGAIALDKTGDALKEFTILGSDMSKSSVETFESIGLSGEEMARAIANGGEGAQAALQQTAQGLLGIEDPVERANAAIALFGAPLEDLSIDQIPGFLAGLAGADDVMGDFTGSLDSTIGVMNDNAGSAFDTFKRGLEQNVTNMLGDNVIPLLGNFTGALEENEGSALAAVAGMTGMGGALAGFETAQGAFDSAKEGAIGLKDGFMSAKDTAVGMADSVKKGVGAVKDFDVASKLSSATTKVWSAIQLAFNVIMSANPLMLIVIGVGLLIAAVVLIATKTTWFQTIWDAVWNGITATWDWVWGKLQEGWELLKSAFGAIGDKVTEVKDWIVGKWNELVDFVTGLPGRIGTAAAGMWQSIQDAAGGAKDWVVGKFDELVGFVTGLPGRIASAASGMWDGLKDAFKGAINWIIQKWNDFSFSIGGQKVSVLGMDIEIPTINLNTPDIPYLAEGGPISGGTPGKDSVLAMLMPGEHVLDVDDVKALGGQEGVYRMRSSLPKFAEGGAVSPDQLVNFAKGVEGKPYVWGGVNWGDCSGAISALANYATGRDPFASRFATGTEQSELAARGFKSGLGPSGSLNVGWFNGGPYGGHTAATLPNGVNFEMGGGRGDGQYGGPAAGANHSQFTDHAHLPMISGAMVDALQARVTPYGETTTSPSFEPPSESFSGATSGAMSATSGASAEPQKSFSGRDRVKSMATDIAGIWSDSLIEMTGVGEYLDLADRYTITDSASGAAGASSGGANGVDGDPNLIPWIADLNGFLKGTGLFDTGGVWEPGTFGFNGLSQPEYVLKDAHWKVAEDNIAKVDELVGAGVGGGPRVQINNNQQVTIADQASWQRDQANRDRLALMRFGG